MPGDLRAGQRAGAVGVGGTLKSGYRRENVTNTDDPVRHTRTLIGALQSHVIPVPLVSENQKHYVAQADQLVWWRLHFAPVPEGRYCRLRWLRTTGQSAVSVHTIGELRDKLRPAHCNGPPLRR